MANKSLKIGIRWPDFEVPLDAGSIKAFVQAAEELGYDHITTFDHLVGMSEAGRARGPRLTSDMAWHETLTLLTFMAAVSDSIGFLTTSLILPQRQTVLVAKQVATIDWISNGRLRLGVSVGRNHIEYGLMGAGFNDRGRRIEEQIEVLRRLWTEEIVEFSGTWHSLPAVALSPRPIQQPIPLWIGLGFDPPERVLKRAGRLGDGVMFPWPTGPETSRRVGTIRQAATEAGRDPTMIGMEPPINLRAGYGEAIHIAARKSDDALAAELAEWSRFGATHIEFKTQHCGLKSLDEHIAAMSQFQAIAKSVLE